MNIKELKIGNLLYWKDEEATARVRGILDGFIQLEDDIPTDIPTPIDFLEPIPLTEEWLRKFGFVIGWFGWCEKDRLFAVDVGAEECGVFIYIDETLSHCEIQKVKYVHQLQNLYHALCNEELIPKDNE